MTETTTERLLRRAGMTAESVAPSSTAGKFFSAQPVQRGADFDRIKNLPVVRPFEAKDLPELRKLMNQWLRTPEGTMTLNDMQVVALRQLHDHGRLNVVASVGSGKTLLAALTATVIGAKRPMLVTYARLLDKQRREFHQLSKHWRISRQWRFLSVESIVDRKRGIDGYRDVLDTQCPDLIVADEVHAFARASSARTKRMRKFLKQYPETVFVGLTGTPGDTEIERIALLQRMALGVAASPYPTNHLELTEWGDALDVKVSKRRPPGVLTHFSGGDEDLDAVRAGIGERAATAPGNIYWRKASVDASLYLDAVKFEPKDPVIDELYEYAVHHDTMPDGRAFEEPLYKNLVLRQIALGFCKVLDPAPPKEWRQARANWFAFVKEIVDKPHAEVESPYQVERLVRKGELDDYGLLDIWKEIEPTFVPRHKLVWHSTKALEFCADWLRKEKGIVWTVFPSFGERLATMTELPFFHAMGIDKRTGQSIEVYKKKTGIICAVEPNKTGRNLQAWSSNLITSPLAKSDDLNQLLGRAQPLHAGVLTPSGYRPIGELAVGAEVVGTDGAVNRVTGVFPQGSKDIYRLIFTDGTCAESTEDHLWAFKRPFYKKVRVRTLKEWYDDGLHKQYGDIRLRRCFLDLPRFASLPEAALSVDPYTLGALLGNGSLSKEVIGFTSLDRDVVSMLVLPEGIECLPRKEAHQNAGRATQYIISRPVSKYGRLGKNNANPLLRALRGLGLLGHKAQDKFIPKQYLRASEAQRLRLLQGLCDTDGCAKSPGVVTYSTVSDTLALDVQELVRTLGGTCTIHDERKFVVLPQARARGETEKKEYRTAHVLYIKLPSDLTPFRCLRKATALAKGKRQREPYRALDRVEYVGTEECVCISVSAANRMYITDNFIPTHNTHRQGQLAEEVTATFLLACRENFQQLMTARKRAEFDANLGRDESNKLLTCDWLVPDAEEVDSWRGPRWER